MTADRNPQAEQMAHESMVRCLAAQARAIWPQELELLRRNAPPSAGRVLDVACGTGEISGRVAEAFPETSVVGVDLHEPHLDVARKRLSHLGGRVHFEQGDAFALGFEDDSFDLVLCRHLLQAVPEPERVVSELVRVARPGAWIHAASEDYGMMHFHPTDVDLDRFWRLGPITFGERTGSDLQTGRKTFTLFHGAGLTNVTVDYVVLDPVRVPRPVLAEIFRSWRDGYAEGLAEVTDLSRGEVENAFEAILGALERPDGYGVWQLPIVRGQVQ